MNLSPVEAIGRINESVTVEMLVRRSPWYLGPLGSLQPACPSS
jgi:hypothetical protein